MTLRLFLFMLCGLCAAMVAPRAGLAADSDERTILVVGDSLSAEYGLSRGSGWVALLGARLSERHPPVRMVNASVSGDTTSGGLSRLPEALARTQPGIVVIELGSNDALRGLSLDATRSNLSAMIGLARGAGAQVLILGMRIPPNYGPAYTREFERMYSELARKEEVALVPFLLEGMALDRTLFQDDAIHPNEEAQHILADNVWEQLEPLVEALPAR